MVTARALAERNENLAHDDVRAGRISAFVAAVYRGSEWTYKAAKMIVEENLADHIDMNFGCPVPKVTKRGGGAALPYKRRLFGQIVAAAVKATEGTDIPVTVKFRVGIDDEHHTHLDAGRIAVEEGAQAVALSRAYRRATLFRHRGPGADRRAEATPGAHRNSGAGQWRYLQASDASAMMEATGCDGVVIGRGV